MAKLDQVNPQAKPAVATVDKPPKSLEIAKVGITTANQFARFMSSLISDLIEGSIGPQVGNAAVNAGGKLLKVVEMQYKYGKTTQDGSGKSLELCKKDELL